VFTRSTEARQIDSFYHISFLTSSFQYCLYIDFVKTVIKKYLSLIGEYYGVEELELFL
jgi:hypothetical protein